MVHIHLVLEADVAHENAVRKAVAEARAVLGPVTILVNCAGIVGPAAPLHELDPDEWDHTLAVNLSGPRLVSQEVAPHMIDPLPFLMMTPKQRKEAKSRFSDWRQLPDERRDLIREHNMDKC